MPPPNGFDARIRGPRGTGVRKNVVQQAQALGLPWAPAELTALGAAVTEKARARARHRLWPQSQTQGGNSASGGAMYTYCE